MENFKPVESIDYPGYFEIPGYSTYVVSREGSVVNRKKGTVLSGSKAPAGYINIRLTGDNGRTLTWGRHRLLGFVFKHPGVSTENLVVNHINAIKGNDKLDNLEWTTIKGNIEHAGMLGITDKCIPVSVRDVKTGEITEYASIVECARDYGCSKDVINWRVKIGETRVFPEGKQYRRGTITTPWYIPTDVSRELLMNSRSRITLVRNALTGEISEFETLTKAAEFLGVTNGTLSTWVSAKNQPIRPGYIQVKFACDPTPWRPIADPYLEYEMYTGHRAVKVVEVETGEERIFPSPKDCCLELGINPRSLEYRLKSKGKDVYIEGFTFAYYLDTV